MFERLASRCVLELDDARLAAAHVNLLVMSTPLNQWMLLGENEPATPHGAQPLRRRRRPRFPRGAPQTLTYTPSDSIVSLCSPDTYPASTRGMGEALSGSVESAAS